MPLRDLRCQKCKKIKRDVYFKTTEEIEFKCECGCEEYDFMPARINLPKSGKYSFADEDK